MNRYEHPMGLGSLSLLLFGLSFVPPINVISAGHGATRLAEPDVLHGPGAYATALVVLAFFAFFTRLFYFTEFLAVPALVIAVVSALPWIWGLHVGMILWVASILCLVIAAYRCDGYRERALHPHPTQK
jgi:hypothetical protein